jgi:hypothetical protein
MRTIALDLLLSFVILLLIPGTVLAEVQYETFDYTTIPDVTRPALVTDDTGTYKVIEYTTIPDVTQPVYAPLPDYSSSRDARNLGK